MCLQGGMYLNPFVEVGGGISLDGQRVVMRAVAGASRVEVGLQGLAAGAYFLRLIDYEGRVIVRPFRKA